MIRANQVKDSAIATAIKQGKQFSVNYISSGHGMITATFWLNTEESRRVNRWDGRAVSAKGRPMDFNCIYEGDMPNLINGMLESRA